MQMDKTTKTHQYIAAAHLTSIACDLTSFDCVHARIKRGLAHEPNCPQVIEALFILLYRIYIDASRCFTIWFAINLTRVLNCFTLCDKLRCFI